MKIFIARIREAITKVLMHSFTFMKKFYKGINILHISPLIFGGEDFEWDFSLKAKKRSQKINFCTRRLKTEKPYDWQYEVKTGLHWMLCLFSFETSLAEKKLSIQSPSHFLRSEKRIIKEDVQFEKSCSIKGWQNSLFLDASFFSLKKQIIYC